MILELTFFLIVTALVSLVGAITISIKREKLNNYLDLLVALSVGALFGGAFLHLIPELAHEGHLGEVAIYILGGIMLFFVLEKFVFWHHCHKSEHTHLCFSYMNLVGDGFHNFLDGVLLAAAFLVSIPLGVVTGIAIILHELPQEVGDFGVLLAGGFSRKKALVANLLISLTAFIGAGVALLFNTFIEGAIPILVAITAGGFIYIAGTDLIPELHKNPEMKKSILQLIFIIIGIAAMFALLFLEHAH
ncbi:MAG: ZIP family metal transporter [Candidatus Diapherotrites archaeon]|jgi:zinc and cadmium transporter|uniref:ZIP family metal transporter n=1 Tax=Candidatus Iainarchaeum sp. TaxID=3101447 RepID=A0A8T5GFJ1_9ARCH|nr:ZIP family metal transporter [Candidatus Diapherotrites archaeon]MBT7241567.1 ZIP family metal transporter [Candidatus Diapherotrites archaeon]